MRPSPWRHIHNGTIQAFGQRMVALILGLAMFATVGIASANNPETPATLTPYWMVNTTSKYIGDLAGSASDTLVGGFDSGGTFLAHDYSKNSTGDLLKRRPVRSLHFGRGAVCLGCHSPSSNDLTLTPRSSTYSAKPRLEASWVR